MKPRTLTFLWAIGLALLAGCITGPETSPIMVRAGMSREKLRDYFGEPLRIEHLPSGGEDWYYHFASWKTQTIEESGVTTTFGDPESYSSAGLSLSKQTDEQAIHISAEGVVVEPLPRGKVVKPPESR